MVTAHKNDAVSMTEYSFGKSDFNVYGKELGSYSTEALMAFRDTLISRDQSPSDINTAESQLECDFLTRVDSIIKNRNKLTVQKDLIQKAAVMMRVTEYLHTVSKNEDVFKRRMYFFKRLFFNHFQQTWSMQDEVYCIHHEPNELPSFKVAFEEVNDKEVVCHVSQLTPYSEGVYVTQILEKFIDNIG